MTRQLFTSEQILNDADDSLMYQIQEDVCSTCKGIRYQLTDAEMGWLEHVEGKYSAADYVRANLDENNILTIEDSFDLTKALEDDNPSAGKAAMLSDDTALQRIFFFCWDESHADELAGEA